MKPTRPVLAAVPAPRIDAVYKQHLEDFEVEEVPAYQPSGEGTHSWLWIEKRGLSTLDAIGALARELGMNQREFGYAGLKDAQAVTRQWLSVEHVDPERCSDLALDGVRVLMCTRHGNKLKPGHLAGNRFAILLREILPHEILPREVQPEAGDVGVDPTATAVDAAESLRQNLAWCAAHGVPNYFGEQRFGKRGSNLDQGLAILRSPKPKRKAYTYAPRILKLLLSAVQSEVFNRVLTARIDGFDRLLDGDIAWIHATGASFTVVDVDREQPRCAAFEVSPTGPLPGPKMLEARAAVQELENRLMDELELNPQSFAVFRSHRGGRRPLRMRVLDPHVEREAAGVRLRFQLDAGVYATSVLRQLLRDAPWFG